MVARKRFAAALVAALAMFVVACGSSGGGGSSSTSAGGGGTTVKGAKVIDVNSMNNPPKGTVSYCTGKDTTGAHKETIKRFNEKYGSQGYKVKIVEFPASADQQRTQFIQR